MAMEVIRPTPKLMAFSSPDQPVFRAIVLVLDIRINIPVQQLGCRIKTFGELDFHRRSSSLRQAIPLSKGKSFPLPRENDSLGCPDRLWLKSTSFPSSPQPAYWRSLLKCCEGHTHSHVSAGPR